MPILLVVPFLALLSSIAVLPLVLPHFWESNRNRALVCGGCALPVAIYLGLEDAPLLGHAVAEYASFITLLATLYIIAGHIAWRGSFAATPNNNVVLLGCGSLLASLIGTTGASMLLARPLFRSNAHRRRTTHVVVFFIFLVSNVGGLLTPLGDPPLYLGYLRGVPFTWTLSLWRQYLVGVGLLLAIFYGLDVRASQKDAVPTGKTEALAGLLGARNIVFLLLVVGVIAASGTWGWPAWVSPLCMCVCAALCFFSSPAVVRRDNQFSWAPMLEVAILFAGIFVTMQPPCALLSAHGTALAARFGLQQPWQFFWLTGLLSSVLDNAPTYVTATAVASSIAGSDATNLATLCQGAGAQLLDAIACGAVMMGANTYLGNGPNFMVKALAEQQGLKAPSFVGYMGYSATILLPIFALLTLLFYRT